jgi:hypothetical protein
MANYSGSLSTSTRKLPSPNWSGDISISFTPPSVTAQPFRFFVTELAGNLQKFQGPSLRGLSHTWEGTVPFPGARDTVYDSLYPAYLATFDFRHDDESERAYQDLTDRAQTELGAAWKMTEVNDPPSRVELTRTATFTNPSSPLKLQVRLHKFSHTFQTIEVFFGKTAH